MFTNEETSVTTTDLTATLEIMDGTCYPTHHDYTSTLVSDGPAALLMFCRLCGDVRALEVRPEPTPTMED